VSSILIPLLAAAAMLTPSNVPDRPSNGPVLATAAASATIVPVGRFGCCRAAAGTVVDPIIAAQERSRVIIQTGQPGVIRHDLEFE
jgi:hypothetical protein